MSKELTPVEIEQTKYEDTLGLIGRKITYIRWATTRETEQLGYIGASPVIIKLDDDTLLIPQMDDEGNDGGALYVLPGDTSKEDDILGVQRW
tara:strand:- start:32 stop:307 length:276 start_codon:yes stop_codon:yes gene_type:complete